MDDMLFIIFNNYKQIYRKINALTYILFEIG